jgi:hypothetical protein
MLSASITPPISLRPQQYKDKANLLQYIRKQVVKGTGKPLETLLLEYSELRRYQLALQYVTTTNKAVCCAMFVPVEAGTRYKAHLEKNGYLVSSVDVFNCPVTGDKAHLLSTNPTEFDRLRKSKFNQLKLF